MKKVTEEDASRLLADIEKLKAAGLDISQIEALELPTEIYFDAVTAKAWRWWNQIGCRVEIDLDEFYPDLDDDFDDLDDEHDDEAPAPYTAWWRSTYMARPDEFLLGSMSKALDCRAEVAKERGDDDYDFLDDYDIAALKAHFGEPNS